MAHWKPVTIFHSFKMMRFHWPLRTAWPQGFLCSVNFRQKLGLSCCLKGVLPHTAGYPTLEIHKVRGFLIFWSKLGTIYMLLLIQWGTYRQRQKEIELYRPMSFYRSHANGNKIAGKRSNCPHWGSILLGLLGLPKLSRNSACLGSQKFASIHLQQGSIGYLTWVDVEGYLCNGWNLSSNPQLLFK